MNATHAKANKNPLTLPRKDQFLKRTRKRDRVAKKNIA